MIVAKAGEIRRRQEAAGWGDLRLADELGISAGTYRRMMSRKAVGEQTIAGALRLWVGAAFEDLFEIVDDDVRTEPGAVDDPSPSTATPGSLSLVGGERRG